MKGGDGESDDVTVGGGVAVCTDCDPRHGVQLGQVAETHHLGGGGGERRKNPNSAACICSKTIAAGVRSGVVNAFVILLTLC